LFSFTAVLLSQYFKKGTMRCISSESSVQDLPSQGLWLYLSITTLPLPFSFDNTFAQQPLERSLH
jgi:hypothetical protein